MTHRITELVSVVMKPTFALSLLFARLVLLALLCVTCISPALAANPWLVIPGGDGVGKGKHIVFIAAEESYRSEESMPLMELPVASE